MGRRLGVALALSVLAGGLLSTGSARAVSLDGLTISAPPDISVAATSVCGQSNCVQVNYSYTVSGGYPPYNLICNLDSGTMFLVGSHTVSCLAKDSEGDSTPPATFVVTVTPGGPTPGPPPPPPAGLSISAPPDISVAATSVCGQSNCVQVNYSYTVSGGYPPYNLICNLDSGTMFLVGSHTVSCLAKDSEGDSTPPATFVVTVTPGGPTPGPPPPPPAGLSISAPPDISVAATSVCGQSNCVQVNYSYTVSGGYPPYNLICNLDSGTMFLVGSHTVSCLAKDSEGDSTPPAAFVVTVTQPSSGATATTTTSSGSGSQGSGSSASSTSAPSSSSSSGSSSTAGSTSSSSESPDSAAGSAVSSSGTASSTATPVISLPVVTTTPRGKQTMSFSVQLGSSAALTVTLVEPSGKKVLTFNTNATKGRTTFTKNIPTVNLKKGSHLTLDIVSVTYGKTHTATIPLKV